MTVIELAMKCRSNFDLGYMGPTWQYGVFRHGQLGWEAPVFTGHQHECTAWIQERHVEDIVRVALEQAAVLVDTWHISKGGFTELAHQIRGLKP